MLNKTKFAIAAILVLLLPHTAVATPPVEPLGIIIPNFQPEEVILDDTGAVLIADNALVGNPALADELYQKWVKEQEQLKKRKAVKRLAPPTSYDPCSCVSYARWKTGIYTGSIGLAKYHPINSQTPVVGAIVVTSEGWGTGHLAAVIEVTADYIVVSEANYSRCKVTTRSIPRNSPLIRGYFH